MRVFVTGASGFVGSAVVAELIGAGHTVLGLARSDANSKAIRELGAEAHPGSLHDLDSLREGAAATDGTIHCAFIHDFTKFAENGQIDKRAIEVMGEALVGTDKPLIVTSGVAGLAQGRPASEDDVPRSEGMPRVSEQTGLAFASRGVRAMTMRLPQVHGAPGKCGLLSSLAESARRGGVAAYIGDGSNRWAGAHVLDVAPVYRLALEKGRSGARYHAVGEEGVPMIEMMRIVGEQLRLPVKSIRQEEAPALFGPMAGFAGLDLQGSSARTQAELGWKPTHIGMIEDISQPGYFG
ncbi:MAG TPA: SDR family oxidoreductase [Bauldia sp.]|nr:SDR family oxidoreductase [Bauldia sp.]